MVVLDKEWSWDRSRRPFPSIRSSSFRRNRDRALGGPKKNLTDDRHVQRLRWTVDIVASTTNTMDVSNRWVVDTLNIHCFMMQSECDFSHGSQSNDSRAGIDDSVVHAT